MKNHKAVTVLGSGAVILAAIGVIGILGHFGVLAHVGSLSKPAVTWGTSGGSLGLMLSSIAYEGYKTYAKEKAEAAKQKLAQNLEVKAEYTVGVGEKYYTIQFFGKDPPPSLLLSSEEPPSAENVLKELDAAFLTDKSKFMIGFEIDGGERIIAIYQDGKRQI